MILDGFDELLQASGRTHANYLEKVQAFQAREAVQGRPVRVIVTSRTTLIDKALIPNGAAIVRLLDFDAERQAKWIEIWNSHNGEYFTQADVRPFALPSVEAVRELAGQPLLLLMLALFDSDRNQLSVERNLDRTLLYDSLLRRFIERERQKGEEGSHFRALPATTRRQEVDEDMRRLGVAAMSMFNRRTLHILRGELDADIAYFELERRVSEGFGARLSQAELLLGSFFFVHESKTRAAVTDRVGGDDLSSSAFEFLHNTFGEFLAADFILSTVMGEAVSVSLLRARPQLRAEIQRKLSGASLPKEWFVSLMYAPLYTRPVILEMMREWIPHLLGRAGMGPEEFRDILDELVTAQLCELLDGNTPPAVMTADSQTPFKALALLGHYAVYSLNLVLLRAVVDEVPFSFDNERIAQHEGGAGGWDQLTHLWRSWLAIDNLAGLGAVMVSTRRDGVVEVRARQTFGALQTAGRLDTAWATAHALGDRFMLATLGPHVYDAGRWPVPSLNELRELSEAEHLDLGLALRMRDIREGRWPTAVGDVEALRREINRAAEGDESSHAHRDLLCALLSADAPIGLRMSGRRAVRPPRSFDLVELPDDFGGAWIRYCARVQPLFAEDLFGRLLSQVGCSGVTALSSSARNGVWRLRPAGACWPPFCARLRSCATSDCQQAKRSRSGQGRPGRAERSEPRSGVLDGSAARSYLRAAVQAAV